MAQKNVICIIPARGGSKRIKNKNIIDFFGKPLISYSINVAIQSKLFDKIIVSTDSPKISNISKKYGAEVPFLRSKKLSNDFTGTNDVLIDTVKRIAAYDAKYVFCIYPTAPLITVDDLKKAFYRIKKKKI
jgi:CMP-N-acetylneuraminic acid synthetase